ncbi:MAG TPA: hypothetical protein PK708_12080 [Candidatus Competibacter sp.]|nr:hypothetical protein [Candidatus Competibacter sp.]
MAKLKKKVSIDWDNGPARGDGMVPFFSRAVTVDFALDPITVAVSSDYPVGSCPYRVTLKHEIDDHARAYVKLFLSYRDILVSQLNAITFPTEGAPRWIMPKDIQALQDRLSQQVQMAVMAVSSRLVAAMDADRQAKDSQQAYAALYRQCPAADWKMRGR